MVCVDATARDPIWRMQRVWACERCGGDVWDTVYVAVGMRMRLMMFQAARELDRLTHQPMIMHQHVNSIMEALEALPSSPPVPGPRWRRPLQALARLRPTLTPRKGPA